MLIHPVMLEEMCIETVSSKCWRKGGGLWKLCIRLCQCLWAIKKKKKEQDFFVSVASQVMNWKLSSSGELLQLNYGGNRISSLLQSLRFTQTKKHFCWQYGFPFTKWVLEMNAIFKNYLFPLRLCYCYAASFSEMWEPLVFCARPVYYRNTFYL